jgi:competence protein ComEC
VTSPHTRTWHRRWQLFAALLGILLLACTSEWVFDEPTTEPIGGQTLQIVVLDVGQGDAIVVISPGGQTMLIDGGNSAQDGEQVIVPYLQDRGFDRLNVMVLTHPDADHVGGLPTVLRQMPVDVVVSTGQVHTTQIYAEFLQEVKIARDERGTRVIRGTTGAEIPFDPAVRLQVLGPGEQAIKGDDLNNASIVLRIVYGQLGVLLTGDAEEQEEQWMIDQGLDLEAQVLKVSHHGSSSGTTAALLDATHAQIALISCGDDNPYGHPHREVLQRLSSRDIQVYRTDRQGTIEVTLDGSQYWVDTTR